MKPAFVTFLWNEQPRARFAPWHVNVLHNGLRHFADFDFRFVCITDDKGQFSDGIETMRLPDSARELIRFPPPQGMKFPSCYRRLWLLSDEAACLGDRVIQNDLDMVWLGNPRPIIETAGDFVAYNPKYKWGRSPLLNGSMWMLNTGKHEWLWQKLKRDPVKTIEHAKIEGWMGSDQAILSCYLHDKCSMWNNKEMGIYAPEDARNWNYPPKDARVAMFNGTVKPWTHDKLWTRAYCDHFRA
jgi:hypothetical protein